MYFFDRKKYNIKIMPNEIFKNHHHHISFKLALQGIFYAFTTQPNFLIMGVFAFLAIIISFYFQISQIEFLIILWTIFLVFITEMINTSIESITDLVTKEYHEEAKIAKDVSSGMVLLTVIGSLIIGIIIFLPKI